jgi:hypothetical protein
MSSDAGRARLDTRTRVLIFGLVPAERAGLAGGLLLVSGAVGVGIATAVFSGVSRAHRGGRAGSVAGLHAGLRVDAAIACLGLVTVWGVVRPARSGVVTSPERVLGEEIA